VVRLGYQVAELKQGNRVALDVGKDDAIAKLDAAEKEPRPNDRLWRVGVPGRIVEIAVRVDRPPFEETAKELVRSHFNLRVRATRACNQPMYESMKLRTSST
jgi:hypothetical protein